jgi:two-component system, cell cycle response regulator
MNDIEINSIFEKISNIILTAIEVNKISDESVCRYGDDKIIIFLDNYTVDQAMSIAERIIIYVRYHSLLQKYALNFPITISFGLASSPTDEPNVQELMNNAEQALEIAKNNGGNSCVIYEKN